MKTVSFDLWRKTVKVQVPPDASTEILMEVEMSLIAMYGDYVRDVAFEAAMEGRSFGEEETRDAKAWFDAGWAARGKQPRGWLRGSEND